jgi:ParB family chromosome partitioning protein
LPENIQEELRKKRLSMGHARALLALEDHAQMIDAGKEITEKKLSVRATEKLVKLLLDGKKKKAPKKEILSKEDILVLQDKANTLRRSFGTQVKITPKTKESGIIEFEFYSSDDLERLLDLFNRIDE